MGRPKLTYEERIERQEYRKFLNHGLRMDQAKALLEAQGGTACPLCPAPGVTEVPELGGSLRWSPEPSG